MSEASLAVAVEQITPLLPVPMDLTVLVANLAASLNANIELTTAAFSIGSTTGAVIRDTDDGLIIIFDKGANPAQQLHIVLHEIGHLLLQHQLIMVPVDGLPNLLAHPLKCPYPLDQEHAAEDFASAVAAIVSVMPVDLSERSRSSSILL